MLGNKNRAADGVAQVVLFVRRNLRRRPVAVPVILGIEKVVAHELKSAAVEALRAGLGFDFDRPEPLRPYCAP